MKLVRYGEAGQERPGLLDADGGIRDLSAHVDDIGRETLLPASLARLAALDPASLPAVDQGVRLGACVGGVRNFMAVGLNFSDHARESGFAIPEEPVLFCKAPSCLCGPDDDIILPPGSQKTDWEVELVIVIGDYISRISAEKALDAVAGYALCNDVSERAMQHEGTGQWVKGKGCPTFGPLGPWLATPDEIPDVMQLDMYLDVNGERMQTGSTKTMIFDIPYIVAYVSDFMALEPGDLITTGTPPGVGMGMDPQRYLKDGDSVELGVSLLGKRVHRVRAAT